jgi:predicted mannosyl-3-phosphoglycerate phosphatase (HAD superfamily)
MEILCYSLTDGKAYASTIIQRSATKEATIVRTKLREIGLQRLVEE